MFTTGSKLLLGATVASLVATLVYGILAGGLMGTIGLVSATAALGALAGIVIFTRDANVAADDIDAFAGAAAATDRPGSGMWPLAIGLAAATMSLGLVTYTAIFILGLVLLIAGTAEWMLLAWAERASSDARHNAEVRGRLAYTAEMPAAAAIGLGIVIYAFSRVMLGLPSKTATIVGFSVAAALVLAMGALVGSNRKVSAPTLTGLFAVAGVVLISGGAVAGLNGEREMKVYKTTAYYAAKDECGAEEVSADKNSSQTVAGKASQAAEVTLDDTGLTYVKPGDLVGRTDALQLPRSNANNVVFRNETAEPRRLLLELAPDLEGSPPRMCTQLVKEGGAALLTVNFAVPSFDPAVVDNGGYAFTVPGVDGARLEVVVP